MKTAPKIISPYPTVEPLRFVRNPLVRRVCDGAGAVLTGAAICLAVLLQISFVVAAGWVVLQLA